MFKFLYEFSELKLETRMEPADLVEWSAGGGAARNRRTTLTLSPRSWAPAIFRSTSRVFSACEVMITAYSFVFAKQKAGRTFSVQREKAQLGSSDHGSEGYIDVSLVFVDFWS